MVIPKARGRIGIPERSWAIFIKSVKPVRKTPQITTHIRDWRTNGDAINRMRGVIDDILFEIAEEYGIDIPLEEHEAIIDRCIAVAIANED